MKFEEAALKHYDQLIQPKPSALLVEGLEERHALNQENKKRLRAGKPAMTEAERQAFLHNLENPPTSPLGIVVGYTLLPNSNANVCDRLYPTILFTDRLRDIHPEEAEDFGMKAEAIRVLDLIWPTVSGYMKTFSRISMVQRDTWNMSAVAEVKPIRRVSMPIMTTLKNPVDVEGYRLYYAYTFTPKPSDQAVHDDVLEELRSDLEAH